MTRKRKAAPDTGLGQADRMARLGDFARTVLGHEFADLALLDRALTHGSATRQPGASYQRLEFLGDRVLGCVVASLLYGRHDEAEGRLTARLHAMVEGPANARVARGWDVGPLITMEPVSRAKGLAESDNVLGDVAEALVAAVFVDGGWEAAARFVTRHWGPLMQAEQPFLNDPKSSLQQWALKRRLGMPEYLVVGRDGPDHAPLFTVEATVRGSPPATGTGKSRQEAEKAAASLLLKSLDA
ncbi:ribonuclease III [Sandarakinorhabdus oryzae]|uniref:ribonuclease III n=1 Tax=Sandarakinorhabdus oryzae TaxID=2675220 RepID=UPI001F38E548|nr:ribonuclease III [Sandarakinorhabdus oryzae]